MRRSVWILLSLLVVNSHISCAQHVRILEDKDVLNGAERMDLFLPMVKSKSVGLIVNHSSRVGDKHLLDVLLLKGVRVAAVFSPEHGFEGSAPAGEKIDHMVYKETGIPIYSLYGATRAPDVSVLEELDILIFDLQDVGARFYTYISTMQLAMEASATAEVPFMVLDRPNPNGFYVDGPILDPAFRSFIGMQPIPVVHGMTVGELARMYVGEKMFPGAESLELEIIPCTGYDHRFTYEPPVSPSPNLPDLRSILLYPSLCFFEGTTVSVGRGTDHPFQCYGHPELEGDFEFTPRSVSSAKNPKHINVNCKGHDLRNIPIDEILRESAINWKYLVETHKELKDGLFASNYSFFDKLAGSEGIRKLILNNAGIDSIRLSYKKDVAAFKQVRKKYLLYPDFE